jgi:predicted RNA binding protein YcfA (HicA-like mRNA interferase family)
VSKLKCTFAEFIEIIKSNGFTLLRHEASSHQSWKGVIEGEIKYVTIACHSSGEYIPIGTLQSMIRQSGLPKRLFRK